MTPPPLSLASVLLLLLLLAAGCVPAAGVAPEVTLKQIRIEDLPGGGEALACELDLRNPGWVGMSVGGSQHSLYLENSFVASGANNIPDYVPPKGSVEQTVYLYTYNRTAAERLLRLAAAQGSVHYRLTSTYRPGGSAPPLPHAVRSDGVAAIDSLSFTTSRRLRWSSSAPCQVGSSADGRRAIYSTTALGSTCIFEPRP